MNTENSMAAVYTIRHPSSGVFYVGNTSNINARKASHLSQLRQGTHHSKALQDAWNKDDTLTWEITGVPTKEEAARLERELIVAQKDNPLIANHTMAKPVRDETRAAMSAGQTTAWTEERRETKRIAMTGTKHTPETIAKMRNDRKDMVVSDEMRNMAAEKRRIQVQIESVVYRTAQEASRAVGCSLPTVLKRVRSDDPKWNDWAITDK